MDEKVLKKINQISEDLGLEKSEKAIFKIENIDENKKMLNLEIGSWNSQEPWFGIDSKDKIHTLISADSILTFVEAYKKVVKENFDLKLEKSIMKQVPIDFYDVWIVCMEEVKKQTLNDNNEHDLDLDLIVKNVKEKNPNLFLDIDGLTNEVHFERKL